MAFFSPKGRGRSLREGTELPVDSSREREGRGERASGPEERVWEQAESRGLTPLSLTSPLTKPLLLNSS